MKKIMFVCHGNICRSPMAEMIMKSVVKEKGLENEYLIESSAVSFEEIGNGIYPPAERELRKNGIEIINRKAVRFKSNEYDDYDYIICMDRSNKRRLLDLVNGDPDCKIKLFKEFGQYQEEDIEDPWYTDNYHKVFTEIYDLCHCLVDFLQSKH